MSAQVHHQERYPNIFLPRETEIVRAEMVSPTEKHFTLKMKDGNPMDFQPGQILEVSLFGYGEIPIGLASSPTRKNTFDIVVRTVGRVSTAINKLQKGDSLWVRGPLGHGFPVEEFKGKNILIVAGGIGLCPTRSLIQYILDCRQDFQKFTLFFGCRTPSDQLFLDDIAAWRASSDVDFHQTVDRADDTWTGNVGVITTLFRKTEITPDTWAVICGPPIMYKFVIADLVTLGVPHSHIFVDLERRMKCGVGKCGHCQINDVYVCADGPVFCFKDIKNLEEAFS